MLYIKLFFFDIFICKIVPYHYKNVYYTRSAIKPNRVAVFVFLHPDQNANAQYQSIRTVIETAKFYTGLNWESCPQWMCKFDSKRKSTRARVNERDRAGGDMHTNVLWMCSTLCVKLFKSPSSSLMPSVIVVGGFVLFVRSLVSSFTYSLARSFASKKSFLFRFVFLSQSFFHYIRSWR